MRRWVRRDRRGAFVVSLGRSERELLASIAPQVRRMLQEADAQDDVAVSRLFPVAYSEESDAERETEYRLLAQDELRTSHDTALAVLESSAQADRLDADQASAWMRALNSIRLVLGTRLGVTEEGDERPDDPDDPRMAAFAVYDFLTALQAELIDALAEAG